MPAPEMFPRPKPEEACAPELYERATYRLTVDFQRTQNAASSIRNCGCFNILMMIYSLVCVFLTFAVCLCLCRFPKKRSGGMRVVGIQAAFVKADNGFAFANRIFDGKV